MTWLKSEVYLKVSAFSPRLSFRQYSWWHETELIFLAYFFAKSFHLSQEPNLVEKRYTLCSLEFKVPLARLMVRQFNRLKCFREHWKRVLNRLNVHSWLHHFNTRWFLDLEFRVPLRGCYRHILLHWMSGGKQALKFACSRPGIAVGHFDCPNSASRPLPEDFANCPVPKRRHNRTGTHSPLANFSCCSRYFS